MKHPILAYIFSNHFLFTVLLLLLGWFLFQISTILIGLFIAYIIMAALAPFADFLEAKRVPKIIATVIPYFLTIFFLISLIIPIIPFFASQVESLLVSFPTYLDQAAKVFGISFNSSELRSLVTSEAAQLGRNALFITSKVFGSIFSLLTIFVLGFYLLVDHKRLHVSFVNLFPNEAHIKIRTTMTQIEYKLGAWLRGQIVLSVFVGFITWVALSIVGLEFALSLALIAGILEIIPTIGPIIAAVPAVIVALTISPTMALVIIALYVGIQMLENNVLVPRIMGKAVGLNPIIIIIGILIGGELMGFVGALLSIPFISMLVVIFHNIKMDYTEKEIEDLAK